ncbi:MAG: hypothetical protein JWQ66_4423 [Mucilaginibacter sp.]|nr:hypothetical protein [Mucilaginibacter sp.]
MKNIVLITSGQPSLNPRLVKEADALTDEGYNVTVLYSYWNKWGTTLDKQLIATKKWKAVCIGGDPEQKAVKYFISRLTHRIAKIIYQETKGKFWADYAIARSSFFLISAARNYTADLYIAHNLGALPAAINAAKFNKKPCGFDAEDFHRNEVTDYKNDPDFVLKRYLEDRYIPQIAYLSASSPLIAEAYKNIYIKINPVVILNVFPRNLKIEEPVLNKDSVIKLFWFSQTIGINRGLEDVIKALSLLKGYPFELHLLGDLSDVAKNIFNTRPLPVYFHKPILPDDILSFASQFDIGLAVENNVPFNRDICLTNKIFTYLQSALAIVASDTTAQQRLLCEHPGIGIVFEKTNARALADTLLYYHHNRDVLLNTRKTALRIARQELNWEKESVKFLDMIKII